MCAWLGLYNLKFCTELIFQTLGQANFNPVLVTAVTDSPCSLCHMLFFCPSLRRFWCDNIKTISVIFNTNIDVCPGVVIFVVALIVSQYNLKQLDILTFISLITRWHLVALWKSPPTHHHLYSSFFSSFLFLISFFLSFVSFYCLFNSVGQFILNPFTYPYILYLWFYIEKLQYHVTVSCFVLDLSSLVLVVGLRSLHRLYNYKCFSIKNKNNNNMQYHLPPPGAL